MYFCPASHVQWFSDEFPRSDYRSENEAILSRLGRFEGDAEEDGQACITPGLTIVIRAGKYGGANEGAPIVPVGLKTHQSLTHDLKKTTNFGTKKEKKAIGCGLKQPTDCVVFLGKKPKINYGPCCDWFKYDERFGIAAVRARALTSAGMKDIHTDAMGGEENKGEKLDKDDSKKKTDEAALKGNNILLAQKDITIGLDEQHKIIQNHLNEQKKFWNMLGKTFGVIPDRIAETHDLLQLNLLLIAMDALRGQCRLGHSCKKEAKAKIAHVIAQLKEAVVGNQSMGGGRQGSSNNEVKASGDKNNNTSNSGTGDKIKKDDGSLKDLVWRTDIGQKFEQEIL